MSLHSLRLQYIAEPVGQKLSLNTAEPRVREATVRQASDIVTPIYHAWKEALKTGGVNWQRFQAAGSKNHAAWLGWINSTLSWHSALEHFVEELNLSSNGQLELTLSHS
jgi:hypothetical protein